jgi:phosphoglycerate dehydrogenase-like enzyme
MKIFTDISADEQAKRVMTEGVGHHELVWGNKASGSKAQADSGFADAEVAFGQPSAAEIMQAPHVRWVHLSSAGYTRYDTAEVRNSMRKRNVMLTTSSSVYAEPCAEHVFGFMLAQARQLPQAIEVGWTGGPAPRKQLRRSCTQLRGQSAVLLGFGSIARRLVELLRPLEMKIVATRRQAQGDEGVPIITAAELPGALGTADHVVNLLPANADSCRYMAAPQFEAMKAGAAFYNIGRGDTVDQEALLKALQSGKLGAAWLDVTDPEPLPEDHPLLSAPNCFVTPHIGGGHQNESEMLVRHFLKNLKAFESGASLLDRVI